MPNQNDRAGLKKTSFLCSLKKSLNPTVIKLGTISFFGDVASEMLYPITPLFLTGVLGASMASMGFIEGVAEAVSALLKIYAAHWSDRLAKRKPFIVAGYILSSLAKPLTGFAQIWPHVLLARSMDRVGKGLRTAPRDALLSDSVEVSQRGTAFGWHRLMDTLGATVGPLLAILLLTLHPNNLRDIFYWAFIPGLITIAIVLSIKEPSKLQKSKNNWENPFKAWRKFPTQFKTYMMAWGLFNLGNSSDVFLLMKAKAVGFSTIWVILLYCIYNLVYALSSPLFGQLSDRIERKKVLTIGLMIYAAVYLGFAQVHVKWHFWILFIIYGLYMGATEGVGKALAVDFSPKEFKATGIGILGAVTGLCAILSSSIAGIVWDQMGSAWTFYLGALFSVLAIFVLFKVSSFKKAEL